MRILEITNVGFTLPHFLLPLMRALREEGHEVVAACRDDGRGGQAVAEGFRVVDIPFARSLSIPGHVRALRALGRLLEAERFDLVHAHYPVASQLGRVAAARARVACIACTSHGFSFLKPGPWPVRGLMLAAEFAASRCQHVLFTQSTEEARIADRLGLSPKGGAIAIGNGVDPVRFRPARNPAERALWRGRLGARPDTVVVAIVARLVAHKGHAALFDAARRIPDLRLWVVGDRLEDDPGALEADVVAAAERDLGARLRFVDGRQDVASVLRGADLFALPSRFEGMPRSVIEAMMTGLPVVATDIRGTREEVVHDLTGLLVPVDDREALEAALARLAAEPGLRQSMGEAGRARALELYDEARVIARQIDALGLRRKQESATP